MKILTSLRRATGSQLGQNVISNYLAVVWMGGLSLLLVPFYLKHLGPQQWGIVAVCMTMQGLWGLLDAGLSQIMPRDVARARGEPAVEARVYHVFARAYWGLGLIGFILGQMAVTWLAGHWFNQGQGLEGRADIALRLMLVQFLFQFANNASIGFWQGREQQKRLNLRQCAFGTLKHAGAFSLVAWWRADALGYLLPFVLMAAIEWVFNRRAVLRELGGRVRVQLTLVDFQGLAREAGLLVLGVLIGMLVSQVDRLVLSRSVDLGSFGRYVIVANLGLAFLQLQYPLMRAYFPRIVREDDRGQMTSFWRLGFSLLVLCVLPCGIVALLAPPILQVWLGDATMVAQGVLPLRLILLAVALNAIYHLVYQRMLARGEGRRVVMINVFSLLLVLPLTILAARRLGIVAGGLAWLGTSMVQLSLGLWWLRVAGRYQPGRKD